MKTRTRHSGRIERKAALTHIAGLAATWKKAFDKACEHDGIKPDAPFVIFSEHNPFIQFTDKAAGMYCDAVQTYQSGVYVGLKIENRSR